MRHQSLAILVAFGAVALAACSVPAAVEPGRSGATAAPAVSDATGASGAPVASGPAGTSVALPAAAEPVTPSASSSAAAHSPAQPALVLRSGAGTASDSIVTVDPATGRVLARSPIGVPDAAWSVVYAVATSGGSTTVRALDTRTGSSLRQTTIDGRYALPFVVPGDLPTGLTTDGRTLVLAGAEPASGRSQFVLLDTTFGASPRVIDLAGDFEFDAIGPDGHYLFLIERIGAKGSGHYQVRAFDLLVGSLLEGAIVDKRDVDEQMNGRPVARAASAGGGTVYTVYVKEDGTAFVHELGVIDGFALCIDLPEVLRASTPAQADAWRIVSDGDRAYVVNPRLGAALSVGQGDVIATGALPISSSTGAVDAVVDSRAGMLYVGDSNGITVLATGSMQTAGPLRAGSGGRGMTSASGGARILALDSEGAAVVELSTTGALGAAVRRLALPALDGAAAGSLRLIGYAGG